jgi:tetratricopeptide (TPR) repeat protein
MLERAYRKDTAACDVPYELGTLYMRVKKWRDAIAMFEKKNACDTSAGFQFASHLNEGMSMMQLKDFKEALSHIQAAIDRRPDNIQAWLTLAQDHAQLGDDQKKIDAYQKVIDLANADTTAGNGNGGGAGKYDNQKAEAYRMIGVQHLLDKKYAKASEFLKEALKYAPKDCQVLLWIAQSAQNSNNKEEARKFYCRVLKSCPNSVQAKDAEKGLDVLGLKCED